MKYVYIVLVDTKTWFSRCVKTYTKRKFNHIGLSFDGGRNIYTFGRVNERNPFSSGFVIEKFDQGYYKNKNLHVEIIRVEISDAAYTELFRLATLFNVNRTTFKYNLVGVMLLPFGKERICEDKYFCSQFVMTLLEKAGVITKNLSLLIPENARNIGGEVVYSGTTEEFLRGA